jgi:hypothetical protein
MAAESNFEQALVLGDDARAARLYAMHLTQLGRDAEAEQMFCAARSFEPNSVHQEISETMSRYYARRHCELVAAWRDSGKRPRAPEAAFYLALAHVFAGEGTAGRPLAAEFARTVGKRPDLMFAQAELEAWLGEPSMARALLDEGDSEATHFACATLAAAAGDDRRCLDELDAAANRREYATVWLRSDARFDRVRSAIRFERLVQRLDNEQVELSYCGYLIDHDLCPRRFAPNCSCIERTIR